VIPQEIIMKRNIAKWLNAPWWGLGVVFLVAIAGTYLSLWAYASPLATPDKLILPASLMQSRVFQYIWISVTLGAFVTLLLEMQWRRLKFRKKVGKAFFIDSYPKSQSIQFFAEIEQLVPTSKEILLVGAGINLIWEKPILDTILKRVIGKQTRVRICMANPYGPHMESRYIEEEMRNEEPAVGREGMRRNVRALVHIIQRAGDPDGLSFSLFESYPTLATLIFDENIFVYPYAYHRLGNVSPVFHFVKDGSETSQFLINNAEEIVKYSVSARDVVYSRENREYYSEEWIGAGVYIVPKSETALYQFGSAVIGYDIWHEQMVGSTQTNVPDVRPYVGEAQIYGFHATIADSLFFSAQSAIDRVMAELKFLCEDFAAFRLDQLRLIDNFRGSGDMVIQCDDESGTLEALHHELVTRVYKLAVSSNFLAGQTSKQIPSSHIARSKLMLEHYGAPNILNAYIPHFTLCSNSPLNKNEKGHVFALLNDSAAKSQALAPIDISEICLVTKYKGDQRWKIAKSFSLARR
jgi:hypothetical protein